MFCKNCGTEIGENIRYCPECGTETAQISEPTPVQPVNTANNNTVNTDTKEEIKFTADEKKKINIFVKVAILVGLVCFIFPFMSVSCAGEKVNISGLDMIIGNDDVNQTAENYGEDYYGNDDSDAGSLFNIFILGSAVSAILGFCIRKHTAKFTLASTVLLIIFRLSAKLYYKIGDTSLSQLEDVITVKFSPALYIAILIFAVVSITCFAVDSSESG